MAEIFRVIYNAQHGGGGALPALTGFATTAGTGGGGDGRVEYSKEEVEKMSSVPGNEEPKRYGTEAIVAHGPVQVCKMVAIEAGSAVNAAKFAKYVMGVEVTGVLAPFSGKTKLSEAPPTNKEQAEKPINTVAKTNTEATAAV